MHERIRKGPTEGMAPEITIDLYGDWIEQLRLELENIGFDTSAIKSAEEIGRVYYNAFRLRRIPQTKRCVEISKECECPKDQQTGFELLVEKIEKGGDLLPHQSKKVVLDPTYNDMLLNDWGIRHFHLGTSLDNNGWIERTGVLLYARLTPHTAYFLDVRNHKSFVDQELLRILNRNWPSQLEPFRQSKIDSAPELSDEQIKKARKCGMVVAQTIDGDVYLPPGGGYSCSRRHIGAVRWVDIRKAALETLENQIEQEAVPHLQNKSEREVFKFKLDTIEWTKPENWDQLHNVVKRAVVLEENTGEGIAFDSVGDPSVPERT